MGVIESNDICTDASDERLFQIADGRLVASVRQSEVMAYFVKAKPEKTFKSDGLEYTWDEGGMADLFAECYQTEIKFCPEVKTWFAYDGGRWCKDVGSILTARKVKEFTRLLIVYCGEITDEDRRKDFLKFVNKMGDRRFRDRLMKDATDNENLVISAGKFDANPFLINFLNGTYDLKKMEFREHDWRDYLTMQTNFNYTLQEVHCERWEKFVAEVTCNDEDKADYLQKALGYSMLGRANEECMFILYGKTTRNGKSTMLDTIRHLLGDYASTANVKLICRNGVAKDAESASPALAGLKGKRFVTMSENEEAGKLDEGVVKLLTGGESVTARNLYESPIEFIPQFTLWLSCNTLPAVRDKSVFASDRLRVIEFNRHFSAEERDNRLKDYFETEEAMQGIFAWLVAGYFKYKRFGLKMSPEMRKAVNCYEKDNDLVLQFLEQKCERIKDGGTKAKSLYDSYKMWCKSNGYFVCSAKTFNAGINQHPEWYDNDCRIVDGYKIYDGLKLKS